MVVVLNRMYKYLKSIYDPITFVTTIVIIVADIYFKINDGLDFSNISVFSLDMLAFVGVMFSRFIVVYCVVYLLYKFEKDIKNSEKFFGNK